MQQLNCLITKLEKGIHWGSQVALKRTGFDPVTCTRPVLSEFGWNRPETEKKVLDTKLLFLQLGFGLFRKTVNQVVLSVNSQTEHRSSAPADGG